MTGTRVLLILPILAPFFAATACLLAWGHVRLQRALSMAGVLVLLGGAAGLLGGVRRHGIAVSQAGGWPAPFGITLVADHLAAIMILAIGLIAFCGELYSLGFVDRERESSGYHPLMLFLLMGACGAVLAGDVFNLFVWIELMLIASFVLLALGGGKRQLEGTLKYALLNMLASFLLLAGVGLVYGLTGTLNMADLSGKLPGAGAPGLLDAVALLFLTALGIKAAMFPLFFWLPASYHTPPIAITAIFSGLLTKVGVYAMIRVFSLLFAPGETGIHGVILILGGLTMATGVLGVVAQSDLRRLLSFHIISQIGYVLMGLGLATTFSLAAAIYFVAHIMFAKVGLFFVAGVAYRLLGTYDLNRLGGLYQQRPLLAVLFLVPALSLGGIPPLSGFIGKLALVQAGLELGAYGIVSVALAVSLLTLYSMAKIWTYAFWRPLEAEVPASAGRMPLLILPAGLLAALSAAMGVWSEPLFELAWSAGQELSEPGVYVRAVLPESGP